MVALEEAVIARLKTRSTQLEVLIDPEKAMMLKRGAEVAPDDLLAVEEVFTELLLVIILLFISLIGIYIRFMQGNIIQLPSYSTTSFKVDVLI